MKPFLSSTSLTLVDYPEHNEAITGDSLASIQLNYKWRSIIAPLLDKYFWDNRSTISLDNQDKLSELLFDLYNFESTIAMKTTFYEKPIGSAIAISNTSAAVVSTFSQNHTFTHKNIKVTLLNLASQAGDNSSSLEFQATVIATFDTVHIPVHYCKTGIQNFVQDIASHGKLTDVGTFSIQLWANKVGTNGNIGFRSLPVWVVEEWD